MLAEAENALVAKIRGAVIGRKLRDVGALPDLQGDSLVQKFATDSPAVYVAPLSTLNIRDSIMDIGFGVACVARNAGGQVVTRQGDGKIIGLYEMIEAVAALLDGFRAGDVPLYATGVSMMSDDLLYRAGVQVAVITLHGQAKLLPGIDETSLDDFVTFNAQYDIEPRESAVEHAKWLEEPPDYSASEPEVIETLTVQP